MIRYCLPSEDRAVQKYAWDVRNSCKARQRSPHEQYGTDVVHITRCNNTPFVVVEDKNQHCNDELVQDTRPNKPCIQVVIHKAVLHMPTFNLAIRCDNEHK